MVDNYTGGSAFPVYGESRYGETGEFSGGTECEDKGMSLRDYFAGQALAGLCSECNFSYGDDIDFEGMVKDAYRFADAMLAERENGGEK
jgi:hypothetical protein